MPFRVRTETRPAGPQHHPVTVLEADDGSARAELWPTLGGNCLAWQVSHNGQTLDLLYAPDPAEVAGRPTRGGVPVLFPFPNRIRAGRFTWAGRDYQLPLNDSTQQNAIHGFTPRHTWRVDDAGGGDDSAFAALEFLGSRDAPECRPLWPADYRLTLTWTLTASALALRASVQNPDRVPLPFGLGFHPYFRVPADGTATMQATARQLWELADSLPTGRRLDLDAAHDLRRPRPVADLALDDVYTDLPPAADGAGTLVPLGTVSSATGGTVHVSASRDFRELVLFTPPHKQAVCLEPYTCPTDAINLQARGIDAGWRVLNPGATWEGRVRFDWEPVKPAQG
jgi:aldose 1-epimerase